MPTRSPVLPNVCLGVVLGCSVLDCFSIDYFMAVAVVALCSRPIGRMLAGVGLSQTHTENNVKIAPKSHSLICQGYVCGLVICHHYVAAILAPCLVPVSVLRCF